MSELAQRLRERAKNISNYDVTSALLREGADEIDRLNTWADGFTDMHLKERATGEAYQRELQATIDRLTAEVAGLKADAERYVALRDHGVGDSPLESLVVYQGVSEHSLLPPELDAAVDKIRAALAAQEPTAQEQK